MAGTTLGIMAGMILGSTILGLLILRGTVRVGASAGAGEASTQDGIARGTEVSGADIGMATGVAAIGGIITTISRSITIRTTVIPQGVPCRADIPQEDIPREDTTQRRQVVRRTAHPLPVIPHVPRLLR